MRKSNAIKWEEFSNELKILEEFQVPQFEKYFIGDYIRDGYTMTDAVIGLNDFLKSLTKQELDIFLRLKGNFGKSYMLDKTFIEILNYCLPRTNSNIQRPILFAMRFIIERHDKSREVLINSPESLERIANTESDLKGFAIGILKSLNEKYKPPTISQYVFRPNETYNFYKEFREIIRNAKRYIYYADNYSNHVIFDYISAYCDLSKVHNIRIITQQNQNDLRLASQNFESQNPQITVEIRSSNKYHDRYLFFDNEQWSLGPSVKDGGKKTCSILQLKDNAAQDALKTFNDIWNNSSLI